MHCLARSCGTCRYKLLTLTMQGGLISLVEMKVIIVSLVVEEQQGNDLDRKSAKNRNTINRTILHFKLLAITETQGSCKNLLFPNRAWGWYGKKDQVCGQLTTRLHESKIDQNTPRSCISPGVPQNTASKTDWPLTVLQLLSFSLLPVKLIFFASKTDWSLTVLHLCRDAVTLV